MYKNYQWDAEFLGETAVNGEDFDEAWTKTDCEPQRYIVMIDHDIPNEGQPEDKKAWVVTYVDTILPPLQ